MEIKYLIRHVQSGAFLRDESDDEYTTNPLDAMIFDRLLNARAICGSDEEIVFISPGGTLVVVE